MTFTPPNTQDEPNTQLLLPSWVTPRRSEALEEMAFLSGGALSYLHQVVGRRDVPQELWRDRLALQAAEACVVFSGRSERAGELRDAIHLLRPGDLPGPAGETYLAWRRAAERPVSAKALHRALLEVEATRIAAWLGTGQGAPMARAARVLETVLTEAPRAEVAGLILADAALARALGWDHILPMFALGLGRADLAKRGDALRLACHGAVTTAAPMAVRLAADLARRAERLKTVAPKLRAKTAPGAVEVFLSRDAVAPSALPMAGRAARRLCDRLVDLGAVRELTGRDTFRLYGV
ncbi:hypothetical protein A8B82_14100 [Sulfitobacter sp. EhC04]|uniref:DUF1403 family protein n=1 Tax=Sulfitobacter sp. EhC04 TaxID=1849168 RepID=UPI0007F46F6A|nr:DUF1403 family protein [Sulfitobacter sp. EhC04]OAN76859.1 hypothetical protein A8B82_14100 [Sulfitobacter sp. EhC04]